MHVGLGLQFANLDHPRHRRRGVPARARRSPRGPRTSASTRSGRPSTTSPTTSSRRTCRSSCRGSPAQTSARQARHDGHGAAVARPGARRRELLAARPPLGRPRRCSASAAASGAIEFDGFRVEMGESRRRFTEYTEAILDALETGVIEYDGELYQQPRIEIRPAPLASFKGRTFASAISPQSMDLMARLGVGLMVIAQKPWETVEEELRDVPRALRRAQRHGGRRSRSCACSSACTTTRPRRSGCATCTCSATPARPSSTTSSTTSASPTSRATSTTPAWRRTSTSTASRSSTASSPTCRCGARPTRSPRSCSTTCERTDAGAVLVHARRTAACRPTRPHANYDLFASEVLPALQAHDVGGDIGVTYEAAAKL